MIQSSVQTDSQWSLWEKIAFRFSFIYFSLFIIFVNNDAYPYWDDYVGSWNEDWLHSFIPWVGKHILHLPYDITIFTNGSGDTTYDYVMVFVIFVLAIVGSVIWSIIDRRRKNYKKLYYWLSTALRYYIALMLFNYGLSKLIKLQFPSPSFFRLMEPLGEGSPMGFAWNFLGFSEGYNIFMGIAEILPLLLLFRRTQTAGAIVTLGVTLNVMAINYFYDVPVKILSTHLVIITLFLLSRDIKKLFQFFFTQTAVRLDVIAQPVFKTKWKRIGLITIKVLIIGFAVIPPVISRFETKERFYGDAIEKTPYYGLYQMSHFEKNGDTIPANSNVLDRWKYLIIEYKGFAELHDEDTSVKRRLFYQTEIDTLKNEIKLSNPRDTTDVFKLYMKKTDTTFTLETVVKGDSIKASGRRINSKKEFLLMNRGFNWINEHPLNL